MIKRCYFYYCIVNDANPVCANGLLIVTSWLPNQSAAFDKMYKFICEERNCDKSKIECRAFNAV